MYCCECVYLQVSLLCSCTCGCHGFCVCTCKLSLLCVRSAADSGGLCPSLLSRGHDNLPATPSSLFALPTSPVSAPQLTPLLTQSAPLFIGSPPSLSLSNLFLPATTVCPLYPPSPFPFSADLETVYVTPRETDDCLCDCPAKPAARCASQSQRACSVVCAVSHNQPPAQSTVLLCCTEHTAVYGSMV